MTLSERVFGLETSADPCPALSRDLRAIERLLTRAEGEVLSRARRVGSLSVALRALGDPER